jgi:hypothetical protein
MREEALTSVTVSHLETAVVQTVLYSDIFDFPLTAEEIWRWLPQSATRSEVEEAVQRLTPAYLSCIAPYVMLIGREHLALIREQRKKTSAALRVKAAHYGKLITRLPFVRLVAITGSLAAANADTSDDIDYLIVTASGRVWLTRALTMLVVRLASLAGVTLCPNYILSESALALADHDLYTARELLQMKPIGRPSTYTRMLAANGWYQDLLPNATPAAVEFDPDKPSFLRSTVEWVLRTGPFDLLEAWLLRHKGDELRREAGREAVFDSTMCKGHFGGWRERTRREVQARVTRLREMA